jgi:hypothetical protein
MNKHLQKIISSYIDTEQPFLYELLKSTEMIKRDADYWHTYDNYTICSEYSFSFGYNKGKKLHYKFVYKYIDKNWTTYTIFK